jgi:hypothetical protein
MSQGNLGLSCNMSIHPGGNSRCMRCIEAGRSWSGRARIGPPHGASAANRRSLNTQVQMASSSLHRFPGQPWMIQPTTAGSALIESIGSPRVVSSFSSTSLETAGGPSRRLKRLMPNAKSRAGTGCSARTPCIPLRRGCASATVTMRLSTCGARIYHFSVEPECAVRDGCLLRNIVPPGRHITR